MKLLEDKIVRSGELKEGGILKVDNFLNHQIDVSLMQEIGKEFARLFANKGVNKILTIEASGIGIACIAAQYFNNAPIVFAKKTESLNLSGDVYSTDVHSYTKNKDYTIRVDKKYLSEKDNILIIDDFLANGEAALGLLRLIKDAGANTAGIGICIEKAFQKGGDIIRSKGIELHSLAIVDIKDDGSISFVEK
ncbi:MAG: xanthine phosphoribosyltransferase [Clostridia bacterium]|nr:xanthine phosphoribosyltransferase [Clostridia bacterium]